MYIYIYLLVDIDTEETNINTSVRSISPTPTPYNSQPITPNNLLYTTPLKRRRKESNEISMALNKIVEVRNLMITQMTNYNVNDNEINNINIKIDKVETDISALNSKLERFESTVNAIESKLDLLINVINDSNNITLCLPFTLF